MLLCPASHPQFHLFCKTCYALASTQLIIVLPAFARSLSADGEKMKTLSLMISSHPLSGVAEERVAQRSAGEVRRSAMFKPVVPNSFRHPTCIAAHGNG